MRLFSREAASPLIFEGTGGVVGGVGFGKALDSKAADRDRVRGTGLDMVRREPSVIVDSVLLGVSASSSQAPSPEAAAASALMSTRTPDSYKSIDSGTQPHHCPRNSVFSANGTTMGSDRGAGASVKARISVVSCCISAKPQCPARNRSKIVVAMCAKPTPWFVSA